MGKGSLGDVLGEALTKPEHKEGIRLFGGKGSQIKNDTLDGKTKI